MPVRWIGSAPGASETVRRTDHSAMINAECVDWDRVSGAALFGTPMRRAPKQPGRSDERRDKEPI